MVLDSERVGVYSASCSIEGREVDQTWQGHLSDGFAIAFPVTAALGSQGKHGEANALLLRAIGIEEKALGPDHPELAISLRSRANVLLAQVMHLPFGENSVLVPRLKVVQ